MAAWLLTITSEVGVVTNGEDGEGEGEDVCGRAAAATER